MLRIPRDYSYSLCYIAVQFKPYKASGINSMRELILSLSMVVLSTYRMGMVSSIIDVSIIILTC